MRETFTVRKQSFGVGVERTFPRALAEDRADRGRRPRRRPAREALLPARPRRQARPRARAPLHRSGGARRGRAAARSRRRGRRGGRREVPGEPSTSRRSRRPRPEAADRRPPRRAAAGADAGEQAVAEEAEAAEAAAVRRREVASGARRRQRPARCSSWSLIVAVALGLALGIQAFLVKPYRIPTESMVPTLEIGQRVLVNRIGDALQRPRASATSSSSTRPTGAEQDNTCGGGPPPAGPGLRRPDAGARRTSTSSSASSPAPATRISIRDGHVILNGKLQEEPLHPSRAAAATAATSRRPITIPADHYFMMGDNRGASDDSRFWGPVPRDWIIGGAFATYWPPKRIGALSEAARRRASATSLRQPAAAGRSTGSRLFRFDRGLGRALRGRRRRGRPRLPGRPARRGRGAVRLRAR